MHNDRVRIPALYCPFRPHISRHYPSIKLDELSWVRRFNLVPPTNLADHTAANFAAMTCRFYDGEIERLKWANRLLTLLFILDDAADHNMAAMPDGFLSDFLEVLNSNGRYSGKHPFFLALADLWSNSSFLTDSMRNECLRDIKTLFEGIQWEKKNFYTDRIPSFPDYMIMRPAAGGAQLAATLIKVVANITSPVLNELRVLDNLCARLGCVGNDLFSLQKELNHMDNHNLVVVLQREQNLSLTGAIRKTVILHNQYMELFQRMIEDLPDYGEYNIDVQNYVGGLISIVRGNIDWSLYDSKRYGESEIRLKANLRSQFRRMEVYEI